MTDQQNNKPTSERREWEKEFDEKFKNLHEHFTPDAQDGITANVHEEVKSFIGSLLADQQATLKKELAGQIKKIIDQSDGSRNQNAWAIYVVDKYLAILLK